MSQKKLKRRRRKKNWTNYSKKLMTRQHLQMKKQKTGRPRFRRRPTKNLKHQMIRFKSKSSLMLRNLEKRLKKLKKLLGNLTKKVRIQAGLDQELVIQLMQIKHQEIRLQKGKRARKLSKRVLKMLSKKMFLSLNQNLQKRRRIRMNQSIILKNLQISSQRRRKRRKTLRNLKNQKK